MAGLWCTPIGRGPGDRVVALETATGETRWSSELPGDYAVRLVAEGGGAAVLGGPLREEVSPYVPEGRSRRRLALVTHTGAREYELEGNLEPEAISRVATSVFVIQYTPALAPESYQVRRLDLAAGKVGDVYVLDLDEQWAHCIDLPAEFTGNGAATALALSSDGSRLYGVGFGWSPTRCTSSTCGRLMRDARATAPAPLRQWWSRRS